MSYRAHGMEAFKTSAGNWAVQDGAYGHRLSFGFRTKREAVARLRAIAAADRAA
jgi:hypothetical protein